MGTSIGKKLTVGDMYHRWQRFGIKNSFMAKTMYVYVIKQEDEDLYNDIAAAYPYDNFESEMEEIEDQDDLVLIEATDFYPDIYDNLKEAGLDADKDMQKLNKMTDGFEDYCFMDEDYMRWMKKVFSKYKFYLYLDGNTKKFKVFGGGEDIFPDIEDENVEYYLYKRTETGFIFRVKKDGKKDQLYIVGLLEKEAHEINPAGKLPASVVKKLRTLTKDEGR